MVHSSTTILLAALAALSVASPIARELVSRDGLSESPELAVRGPTHVSTPTGPAKIDDEAQAAKDAKRKATKIKAAQNQQREAQKAGNRLNKGKRDFLEEDLYIRDPAKKTQAEGTEKRELFDEDLYVRDLLQRTPPDFGSKRTTPQRPTGYGVRRPLTDRQKKNLAESREQQKAEVNSFARTTKKKTKRNLLHEDLYSREFKADELD